MHMSIAFRKKQFSSTFLIIIDRGCAMTNGTAPVRAYYVFVMRLSHYLHNIIANLYDVNTVHVELGL